MRWLLLDEVLEIKKGKCVRTRSHVPDEDYSAETLMIEMIAQTGALLLGAEHDYQKDMVFAKIEKAEFEKLPEAGKELEIEASSDAIHDEGGWIEGTIHQGRQKVGQARCLLMNIGELTPGRKEPITFHRAFMEHFQVRDKLKG